MMRLSVSSLLGALLLVGFGATLDAATVEAQVAIAELSGPARRARDVRQRLAARLQSADFDVVSNDQVEGDDAASIASATSAQVVITGAVRRRGGRWRADLEVHDASGDVKGTVAGSARGIGGLAAQLARRLEGEIRPLLGSEPAAEAPVSTGPSEVSRIVVGAFSGRGGARIRNQLVRGLTGSYELVPRSDLEAEAERQGGDLDDPTMLVQAAGVLGVRALIDGHVSRAGRRWTVAIKVTDASTGEEVGSETFRGRTSGQLGSSVRSQGPGKLADPIGRTAVPPTRVAEPVADSELRESDGLVGPSDTDEPRRRARRGDLPIAFDLAVYGRIFNRQLEYNDDLYGLLRGYSLQLGPAIEVGGRWYPGAHFTDGFIAHIGLEGSYERAFGIDSVPADPDDQRVFPTRSQEWLVGLRGRVPFQEHFFSLGVGYGSHFFVIEPSGPAVMGRGNLPEIPRTEYDFVRIHGEARLAVAGGFSVTVGGGYRVVLSAGGVEDDVWFPAADVGGVEADLMLGYRLESGIEIRLGFDWRRYFYSMNVGLTSPWIVGGAIDQYLAGSLGIAYRR